jgi:dTDP-4-dehydrorhamnose 3,5-epimerase
MFIEPTEIEDVVVITFDFHEDTRGWFAETYDAVTFRAHGLPTTWQHDSWSLSPTPGTVRGLHFQAPPEEQAKLVRVPHGRVFDVAVDLRRSSPHFGRHVSVHIDHRQAVFIPAGFAHGFCTLEPDTEVAYKMTVPYAKDLARGVAWDDPQIGIEWPEIANVLTVSDRDAELPGLRDLIQYF